MAVRSERPRGPLALRHSPPRVRELWLVSLAAGILFNVLFWEAWPPGVSFPLFVVMAAVGGVLVVIRSGRTVAPASGALLATMVVVSAVPVLRSDPLTAGLSFLGTVLLAMILAHSLTDGHWMKFRFIDHVLAALQVVIGVGLRPLLFERGHKEATGSLARTAPWIRGVILAIPVLIVFGALLASADLIFLDGLESIADWFEFPDMSEAAARLFVILVVTYLVAGVYLHALRAAPQTPDQTEILVGRPVKLEQRLGFQEAMTILTSLDALLLSFVIIQARYLFGGRENIGVRGYTYSEYAVRGFWELLTVAVLSLILLIGLAMWSRRETRMRSLAFLGAGSGLVLTVLPILASAYRRLLLYEEAFGFTESRIYAHVFMVWLGVFLLVALGLVIFDRVPRVAFTALVGAVIFLLTLTALNVDALVVRHNYQRAVQGAEFDAAYLTRLGPGAVPAMVEGLDRLPARARRDARGALACWQVALAGDVRWQSWTIARSRARNAVKGLDLSDASCEEVFVASGRPALELSR